MDPKRFVAPQFGEAFKTIGDAGYIAYRPEPLPRRLDLSDETVVALSNADRALGRLAGTGRLLPNPHLLLRPYVTREALASSRIEGTQASLSDVFDAQARKAPEGPLREVTNYIDALDHGLARLDTLPVSRRLLCEVHEILLTGVRGEERRPGEVRRSQNWIGGPRPGAAAFVPPPPERVAECMGELEQFLHDRPERTPTILKAALAHVQFETIHPFLDGNGRLGRLLTTLLLVSDQVLGEPLLYLSLYLKTHRETYYELLQRVRTHGDWERWVDFFVRGVRETADQAVTSARELARLFDHDRRRIQELGRIAGSALQVHTAFQQHPIQTVNSAKERTSLSFPTVTGVIKTLEEAGIVRELTGKQRYRIFAYDRYLKILDPGAAEAPA